VPGPRPPGGGTIDDRRWQSRHLSDFPRGDDLGPRVTQHEEQEHILMKRYIIEREIPGVGSLDRAQQRDVAVQSNRALAALAGKAQWEHSYVVDDKTFCVYIAEDEGAVRAHAELSGFPATVITEVRSVIEPMTASS
jgi:hypothetical protein